MYLDARHISASDVLDFFSRRRTDAITRTSSRIVRQFLVPKRRNTIRSILLVFGDKTFRVLAAKAKVELRALACFFSVVNVKVVATLYSKRVLLGDV
tara:strand:+ start:468 stop:758 length:291 start_codon:yes stop_codon:yes gene_type:complete